MAIRPIQASIPPDPWDKLDALLAEHVGCGKPPVGAFTTMEYATHAKLSRTQALTRLRELAAKGKIEDCGRFGRGQKAYWKLKD